MRLAVLWWELTGYINSCLKELASRPNVDLFVSSIQTSKITPISDNSFDWIPSRYVYSGLPDKKHLLQVLEDFAPDLLLICGWYIPAYRFVASCYQNRVPRIVAIDNQWHDSNRQKLGIILRGQTIRRCYDFAFVPGERQAVFARKLGFKQDSILYGLYSCSHPDFIKATESRQHGETNRKFLFSGRLIRDKGIHILVKAYKLYRDMIDDPWPLMVCGTGPEAQLLDNTIGIEVLGFVQPERLAEVFSSAGCYVMPSLFEPWCVAIHEATASGLPVICTTSCGAGAHLVQDRYNGILVEPGNAKHLAKAMAMMSRLDPAIQQKFGERSLMLSYQYTPQRWADTILSVMAGGLYIKQY